MWSSMSTTQDMYLGYEYEVGAVIVLVTIYSKPPALGRITHPNLYGRYIFAALSAADEMTERVPGIINNVRYEHRLLRGLFCDKGRGDSYSDLTFFLFFQVNTLRFPVRRAGYVRLPQRGFTD